MERRRRNNCDESNEIRWIKIASIELAGVFPPPHASYRRAGRVRLRLVQRRELANTQNVRCGAGALGRFAHITLGHQCCKSTIPSPYVSRFCDVERTVSPVVGAAFLAHHRPRPAGEVPWAPIGKGVSLASHSRGRSAPPWPHLSCRQLVSLQPEMSALKGPPSR